MELTFDVKVTAKDLYRYNMRNAYTSFQGILSIICAALVVFVFVWKFDALNVPYIILFIVLALAFLLYIPISLWIRSNQIVKTSDVFKEPLTFVFGDESIAVTSPIMTEADEVNLPYNDVFRVTKTSKDILIYTNRVSAYIIPREQVTALESQLLEMLKSKVEDFKIKGF